MNHLANMPKMGDSYLIAAFPGTGKSFYTNSDYMPDRFATDSDSSKFDKSNFPTNYIEHIKSRIDLSYARIFISSHKDVRDALVSNNIKYTLVYPAKHLKDEYIKRYSERGNTEKFVQLLSDNWESWLDDCKAQKGCYHIELQSGEFISNIC